MKSPGFCATLMKGNARNNLLATSGQEAIQTCDSSACSPSEYGTRNKLCQQKTATCKKVSWMSHWSISASALFFAGSLSLPFPVDHRLECHPKTREEASGVRATTSSRSTTRDLEPWCTGSAVIHRWHGFAFNGIRAKCCLV